jgi:pimeloyl-ACP methyl ester carboxylesterase
LLRGDIAHDALLDRYADERSRFLVIDGAHVHYKDEGAGPALVLVHGTNASLHTWDGWVAELGTEHRIIRLDLPGHGLTGRNRGDDYSIDYYARFLDAFLGRLGVERFALAGNSMGGAVSWHYALAHPEKVERLILLDAVGYPNERPFFFSLIGLPVVGRLTTRMTPRFLADMTVREVYGDDRRITPGTYDRYAELSRHEGNRRAMHEHLRQFRTDDWARIRDLAVPTLILWGEADTFIPVAHAARFRDDIPGARLLVYPGVGHVPMEELPAETAADARTFLGGGRGR